MNKISRNYGTELRMVDGSRHIEGCAIVFNSDSEDLGFIERIMPGAITQETIDNSDIFFTFNHDMDKILARANKGNGSLKLDLREDGLYISCDLPNTSLGDEVLEFLNRGDMNKMSFAFSIPENGDKWYRDENDVLRRDIEKIDFLYDVSAVWQPAYEATEISKRDLDAKKNFEDKENLINRLEAEINELKKLAQLDF